MFCKNCGKELQDGECYCSKCGTEAGSVRKGVDMTGLLIKGHDMCSNCHDRLNAMGSPGKKIVYFVCFFIQVISIFLIGKEMFEVSASYDSFGISGNLFSAGFTLFEDKSILKSLFSVSYAVAALAMLLPLLSKKKWQKSNFLPGICMSAASLVWFFIVLLQARSEAGSGYEEYAKYIDISAKLTTNAWVFLLVSTVEILLTIKLSSDLIRIANKAEPVPAKIGGWTCVKCGHQNDASEIYCKMCGEYK
ncbi:MAG: hypothetical protein ACI3V3_02160 [Faecousia sp.]